MVYKVPSRWPKHRCRSDNFVIAVAMGVCASDNFMIAVAMGVCASDNFIIAVAIAVLRKKQPSFRRWQMYFARISNLDSLSRKHH